MRVLNDVIDRICSNFHLETRFNFAKFTLVLMFTIYVFRALETVHEYQTISHQSTSIVPYSHKRSFLYGAATSSKVAKIIMEHVTARDDLPFFFFIRENSTLVQKRISRANFNQVLGRKRKFMQCFTESSRQSRSDCWKLRRALTRVT